MQNEVKHLKIRFFASLRMTALKVISKDNLC